MVRRIRKAAVLGSGVMGGGIAALLASAGIKTLLLDIVPFDLTDEEKNDPKARNRIVQAGFDGIVKSKPSLFMNAKDEKALVQVGNFEDDWDKLAECDWIVEVVVENLKIKQEVLAKVEKVRKADAIVSTNTSGIPLEAMSKELSSEFRQNFMGTHFFNPVRYMKLLELIPGAETKPEVLDFMKDFGERILGKGIVWAKDTPNFIGNRIGVQGMVQAMQLMVEDGMSIPEVDALFGPVLGRPKTAMFKTADLVGLDTLGHVASNTYELVVDDEARETFKVPEFVSQMIEKKMLGNKTKGGFYKKDMTPEWKLIPKVLNPQTMEYEEFERPTFPCLDAAKSAKGLAEKIKAVAYADDKGGKFVWKVLSNGLIYAANRIPEISDTIVEIDNSMKWGYNFTFGPFETWDALGVKESVAKMEAEGMTVPENVKKMLAAGVESFYKFENGIDYYFDFATGEYKAIELSPTIISLKGLKGAGKKVMGNNSVSLVDLEDGVFCVEFHTKMNAINAELVDGMGEALAYVDDNGIGVVIGNQSPGFPGAFSAGGDLAYMLGLAKAGKYADIDAFLARAQGGMMNALYSSFPVVAAPFGMTLGGGCETCLAADKIVAHSELFMGLVEVGVGLIPGGGGCMNTWKKFALSTPPCVKVNDLLPYFMHVFQNIAMAKFSNSAAQARTMGFLGPKDRIVMNRDYLIGEAKKEVLRMVDAGYAPPQKKPIPVLGKSAQGLADQQLFDMLAAGYISEHDALIAKKVAYIIGGGDVRDNSTVDEDYILKLERDAFVSLFKEEKTIARVEHMLATGKPLRN
ncbi:3-hydroxyacyl-CoA dehydrogenase/enoyl-CoA hydratase family protein [Desulfatibacillum aliphaticivorans]|uniref:3-hydroxyacyl-CoA dehydrogenase/enoyl-CoA hydratase family protein n=1 Tax=Desulfatibacillum aliphaticivorans TaxID=218208 RepID=UPI00048A1BE5|nr:3-hydroxyacyl-CoA dehydrogenase/enoyl-CoA hydratase family protein [Desulfatibacillum aliphaticivorans]